MSKAILSFICFILLSNQVLANELLVISGKNSKNSKKWQEEVYQESIPSGVGRISVKIVTIEADKFPKWITQAMKEERMGEILGTPTFIIWLHREIKVLFSIGPSDITDKSGPPSWSSRGVGGSSRGRLWRKPTTRRRVRGNESGYNGSHL